MFRLLSCSAGFAPCSPASPLTPKTSTCGELETLSCLHVSVWMLMIVYLFVYLIKCPLILKLVARKPTREINSVCCLRPPSSKLLFSISVTESREAGTARGFLGKCFPHWLCLITPRRLITSTKVQLLFATFGTWTWTRCQDGFWPQFTV